MRIIGCDLHARQQTIAMLDTDTRELVERTLEQEGEQVGKFYAALPGPVRVGVEATGSMQWFLQLMEELKIDRHVGHPAKIRKVETRQQKHDRRDARLLLKLLVENRFLSIWMPSSEQRDLRTLLRHRPRDAYPRAVQVAIHGAQSRSATPQFSLESSRPTRAHDIAIGSSCKPTAGSPAGVVPSVAGINRRPRSTGSRPGATTSTGLPIDDPSRSWADYGTDQGSVPG